MGEPQDTFSVEGEDTGLATAAEQRRLVDPEMSQDSPIVLAGLDVGDPAQEPRGALDLSAELGHPLA
jgi:hypothetical protein